jgi:hypothetical protein
VCTAKIPAATTAWQWFEFKVSMPRIFYVDSPGSNCAGQHLCAGFTTYAWSVVGVAPKQTLQLGKLVAEVPVTATGPVQMSCGSGAPCEGSVKVTLPKDTTSIYSEIIDGQNQKNAERWTELKDAHKSVNGLKNGFPNVELTDTEQQIKKANTSLKSSTGETHTANLQVADAALEQVFPSGPSSAAASAASFNHWSVARSTASDDAAAAFRALTKTTPSARDLAALRSFTSRARSSVYSNDRARARIILALSLQASRYVLNRDLRSYRKSVPLGSVTKRIGGGRKAQARVKLTPVGIKTRRFISTVRGNSTVKAKLTVGNRQGGRTRTSSASVRLF